MTSDDISRMAREAGAERNSDFHDWSFDDNQLEHFAAIVAAAAKAEERNKLAAWMMSRGYATGHGDTTEDLLDELGMEIQDSIVSAVGVEREACAKAVEAEAHMFETLAAAKSCANAIRARSNA
jgi:hypothetical protein